MVTMEVEQEKRRAGREQHRAREEVWVVGMWGLWLMSVLTFLKQLVVFPLLPQNCGIFSLVFCNVGKILVLKSF